MFMFKFIHIAELFQFYFSHYTLSLNQFCIFVYICIYRDMYIYVLVLSLKCGNGSSLKQMKMFLFQNYDRKYLKPNSYWFREQLYLLMDEGNGSG